MKIKKIEEIKKTDPLSEIKELLEDIKENISDFKSEEAWDCPSIRESGDCFSVVLKINKLLKKAGKKYQDIGMNKEEVEEILSISRESHRFTNEEEWKLEEKLCKKELEELL